MFNVNFHVGYLLNLFSSRLLILVESHKDSYGDLTVENVGASSETSESAPYASSVLFHDGTSESGESRGRRGSSPASSRGSGTQLSGNSRRNGMHANRSNGRFQRYIS